MKKILKLVFVLLNLQNLAFANHIELKLSAIYGQGAGEFRHLKLQWHEAKAPKEMKAADWFHSEKQMIDASINPSPLGFDNDCYELIKTAYLQQKYLTLTIAYQAEDQYSRLPTSYGKTAQVLGCAIADRSQAFATILDTSDMPRGMTQTLSTIRLEDFNEKFNITLLNQCAVEAVIESLQIKNKCFDELECDITKKLLGVNNELQINYYYNYHMKHYRHEEENQSVRIYGASINKNRPTLFVALHKSSTHNSQFFQEISYLETKGAWPKLILLNNGLYWQIENGFQFESAWFNVDDLTTPTYNPVNFAKYMQCVEAKILQ